MTPRSGETTTPSIVDATEGAGVPSARTRRVVLNGPSGAPWTHNGAERSQADGSTSWILNDALHRLDGPAYAGPDGWKEWWVEGVRHRLDGPAVIEPDGSEIWMAHGHLHRVGGPAATFANGSQEWWLDGELHRVGGPALVRCNGAEEWWVHDINITTIATLLPDLLGPLGDHISVCTLANEDAITRAAAHLDPARLRHELGLLPTGPPTPEHVAAWHLLAALR